MTFEDAIKKAIKAHFKGLSPEQLRGPSGKKTKYTKKYFDKVGEEYEIEPYELKGKK